MTTPDPRTAALALVQAMIAAKKDGMEIELGPIWEKGPYHGTWRVKVERVEE